MFTEPVCTDHHRGQLKARANSEIYTLIKYHLMRLNTERDQLNTDSSMQDRASETTAPEHSESLAPTSVINNSKEE